MPADPSPRDAPGGPDPDPYTPDPAARGPGAHRAPQDAWRPMSGLCLTAFILAIVLAILSFLTLWVGAVLPFVLGLLGLSRTDGTRMRGRALAGWAVAIAAGSGAVGLFQTQHMHGIVERLASGVIAALRAERPEEERDRLLDAWLASTSDRAEVRERLQARFAAVVRRAGPATGGPVLPGLTGGSFPMMLPPADVEPVDGVKGGDMPVAAGAFWVRMPFQRGEVHVAFLMGEASFAGLQQPLEKLSSGSGAVEVLRDLRFFAERGLLPPDPEAPPTPPPSSGPEPAPQPAPQPGGR